MALLAKLDDMGKVDIPPRAKGANAIKPTASTSKAISSRHSNGFIYSRRQETAS